ncbi:MAG: hypothetical protein KDC46_15370 [Thermoleophilia bacterium]|nr:hypothetical protein [Thermoleophilia bacterium]
MLEYALKGTVAGILVAAALWAQDRSTALAAILVSLPLTSIVALVALWMETGSRDEVSQLSWAILVVVAPSVVLFLALPLLLRTGLGFWIAMPLACITMAAAYWAYARVLARFGVG